MSHITFDIKFKEAMEDLSNLLEVEDKKDSLALSKGLSEYSLLYVKYLQIYRKLEECYDQIIHAQKRIDLRKTLETCIGRILELKHWMVSLNHGSEFLNFYPALKDLNLGPEVLEIPHPRFMIDDNAGSLEARQKLMVTTSKKMHKANETMGTQPLVSEEEAIEIIQANERGRQSRQRIAELIKIRKMQEEELQHKHSGGEALSADVAARKIQALARGFLMRCHVKHSAQEELTLLGMNCLDHSPSREKLYQRMKDNYERRKNIQALNKLNYDEAFVFTREKVKELEGQEMREIIQEEINCWLLQNRDPETSLYPPFPRPDEGGSKYILYPPPKMEFIEEDKKKDDKKDAKKTKKTRPSMLKKVPLPKEDGENQPPCPCLFRSHLSKCVQIVNNNWHDRDDSSNLTQKYDSDLLKSSLRPVIFEEVRLEVDQDTRTILNNIKKKLLSEAKALKKKEIKKETKSSKKNEENLVQFAVLDMGNKPTKKPPKDKTAQRTVESIFMELVENGIVQLCPKRTFEEYVGADNLRAAKVEDSDSLHDLSMAQVRRLVVEYCVLPLASDFVHKNAPFIRSVLLYGGARNGKTLLVHSACSTAGATFINLSPRNTDGKYPGSQASKMVQMAFKIAKIMAPSIIYIDEVEMVFIKDKKKLKACGLKEKSSRIKTSLLKEMALLQPGDRVLLIGTSSKPQDAPSKLPSLVSLFMKRIYVPYPDHASRFMLWRALLERHGAVLSFNFNFSILAHLSADYSPGSIEEVCKFILTKRRLRKLRSHPLSSDELINHLYEVMPLDKTTQEIIRNWDKQEPKSEDGNKESKGAVP